MDWLTFEDRVGIALAPVTALAIVLAMMLFAGCNDFESSTPKCVPCSHYKYEGGPEQYTHRWPHPPHHDRHWDTERECEEAG